jgi:aminoglycoside phosphotransferase (APT) family kinase protein
VSNCGSSHLDRDAALGIRAPVATNTRVPWVRVPARVRAEVERKLGAPVVSAVNQSGGFSPGVAARARLADGRRVFIKAVAPELNPDIPNFHRSEARIVAAIPESASVPRLLFMVDTGDWVVLVFQDIEGVPPREPWRLTELGRVLDATVELAAALDPAPVSGPTLAQRLGKVFQGWHQLGASTWPDPWTRRHYARLAELEAGWTAAAAGTALIHADLRADNVLLAADRVWFVDWAHGAVGAPWFDVVFMAGSVIMHNGRAGQDLLDNHLADRDAAPEAVLSALVATIGFFLHQSTLPAPVGLPTLREFQRAQGEAALGWLRERANWS